MEIPERVQKLTRKSAPALIENFGPLQGIRVLSTGSLVAGPHGPALMADMGAEVIHVENPGLGDPLRMGLPHIKGNGKRISAHWADNGRNRLAMELDMRINKNPKAREVFLGLIKVCDIWVENMVWLEKRYGITDELILQTNPKIVIVHSSGYGKPEFGGEPNKCWRAAYDIVGQAYGGFTHLTGSPDAPPTRLEPYTADFVTGTFVALGALMGYINARKTGKGQVVDVSQFESIARIMADLFPAYLNTGHVYNRSGNKHDAFQPYDLFETSDGYAAVGAFSVGVYNRFIQAMAEATGINPADNPAEECTLSTDNINSPKGLDLDKKLRDWMKAHTKTEASALFDKYQVPCGPVYTAKDAAEDEHWIGRGDFVECIDQTTQQKVKIFGITPKALDNPGKIWRGAPAQGQDTDDILNKLLNFTPEEIAQLRAEKVVCK